MMQSIPSTDPMYNILMLKAAELMDGVQFDDVREYARKQLLLQGLKKPETEEEMIEEEDIQTEETGRELRLRRAVMRILTLRSTVMMRQRSRSWRGGGSRGSEGP